MNASSFHNNSTSTRNVPIPGCRPVLTVPANLYFETDDIAIKNNTNNNNNNNNTTSPTSTNPITNENSGYDIYLHENWDSGIGGGLWTTGLALAKYFTTSQHFLQQFYSMQLQKKSRQTHHHHPQQNRFGKQPTPLRVLELGSGNGFLSVCFIIAIAVATSNTNSKINVDDNDSNSTTTAFSNSIQGLVEIDVVVTDTKEHLQLMKETIDSNLKRILPQILVDRTRKCLQRQRKLVGMTDGNENNNDDEKKDSDGNIDIDIEQIVSVKEYLWGEEQYDFGKGRNGKDNNEDSTYFDLIIGSDVVYRDHLHDPFIQALNEFSSPSTIAIIGVTMSDTKPIFFTKLIQAGFHYEKLAEHLFDIEFNTCDRQFGIFVISRTTSTS